MCGWLVFLELADLDDVHGLAFLKVHRMQPHWPQPT